jgi:polyhydroxyalkanoate synthase subunit PhaC
MSEKGTETTDHTARPTDVAQAMQGMLQASQAATQQFFQFLVRQPAVMQTKASLPPSLPMPDSKVLEELQHTFTARHTELWTRLFSQKPGEKIQPVVEGVRSDRRFKDEAWEKSPFYDYLRQAYLINADYLNQMAKSLPLADGQAKARIEFLTRQYVDALAPSNFAATNPEFIEKALETKGESITQGVKNLIEDLEKGRISMTDESVFEVGRNIAISEGAVIYENRLMQLIQYTPLTKKVAETPLLIVPPCINKFYIMDLAPENSLVRFAVEQGLTVFLISWKNPKEPEACTTWDDYLELGPLQALEIVRGVTGIEKPHALGFCVGGTLLSSALAVARARGEDPVKSLTLMTTLLDFSDAGELGCMVDEASLAAREAAIGKGGLLPGQELATVFSFLRANDLVWQYVVGNYLKGDKPKAFDLLYWNSDSTNLPGPFLTWYLRNMYLENNLRVPGRLKMLGQKVDLSRIQCPSYLMAAREDHIVPWKGAYLSRTLLGGPIRFVLGASGHIAGAINPASKNRRSYWTSDAQVADADAWFDASTEHPGSWWKDWSVWLLAQESTEIPARTKLGHARYKPIEPAPGRYVKERS